jgi:hypothetical protein
MRLRTETLDDGTEMVLENYFGYGVHVPAGFIFDGASTPRIFWSILPPFKDVKVAACIHDYLCTQAKSKADRLYADELFWRILKANPRIGDLRALCGYCGVRIGAFFGIGVKYPHWTDVIKTTVGKIKGLVT